MSSKIEELRAAIQAAGDEVDQIERKRREDEVARKREEAQKKENERRARALGARDTVTFSVKEKVREAADYMKARDEAKGLLDELRGNPEEEQVRSAIEKAIADADAAIAEIRALFSDDEDLFSVVLRMETAQPTSATIDRFLDEGRKLGYVELLTADVAEPLLARLKEAETDEHKLQEIDMEDRRFILKHGVHAGNGRTWKYYRQPWYNMQDASDRQAHGKCRIFWEGIFGLRREQQDEATDRTRRLRVLVEKARNGDINDLHAGNVGSVICLDGITAENPWLVPIRNSDERRPFFGRIFIQVVDKGVFSIAEADFPLQKTLVYLGLIEDGVEEKLISCRTGFRELRNRNGSRLQHVPDATKFLNMALVGRLGEESGEEKPVPSQMPTAQVK